MQLDAVPIAPDSGGARQLEVSDIVSDSVDDGQRRDAAIAPPSPHRWEHCEKIDMTMYRDCRASAVTADRNKPRSGKDVR
jgi:hypothetical protein